MNDRVKNEESLRVKFDACLVAQLHTSGLSLAPYTQRLSNIGVKKAPEYATI